MQRTTANIRAPTKYSPIISQESFMILEYQTYTKGCSIHIQRRASIDTRFSWEKYFLIPTKNLPHGPDIEKREH